MQNRRTVFFVSDRTGITAEALGRSLMSQFDGAGVTQVTLPFIDTLDKAKTAVERINSAAREDGARPLVFSTLVQDDLRAAFHASEALCLDFFDAFIGPLERELGVKSSHTTGKAHANADDAAYLTRIEAVNFALANDDGVTTRHYPEADVCWWGCHAPARPPPACTWRCNTVSPRPTTPSRKTTWTGAGCRTRSCPTSPSSTASPSTHSACSRSARSVGPTAATRPRTR